MNLRVEPVTRPSPESTDTPLDAAQDGGRVIKVPAVAKQYVIRLRDIQSHTAGVNRRKKHALARLRLESFQSLRPSILPNVSIEALNTYTHIVFQLCQTTAS